MKHKKKQPQMQVKTLRMKENHTWKAPDGYKIFVADRGAVSFNIPEKWFLAKFEPIEIHDAEPPDDEVRISMSYWRFPPDIDWTDLPLPKLLADSVQGSEMEILERGGITKSLRTDIEMVWTYQRFLDPVEKRDAFSRIMVARGFGVHVLVTMDFWVDDMRRCSPVWNEILRSLLLGRYIEDPTKGEVLQ